MLFFLRVYYLEILVIFHHDFTFWFAFLLGVPLQTVKPDCQLGFYPQGIFQSIWTSVSFRVYIFVVVKNDQKHLQTTTFDTKKGVQINPNMQINHALPPLQGGCQTQATPSSSPNHHQRYPPNQLTSVVWILQGHDSNESKVGCLYVNILKIQISPVAFSRDENSTLCTAKK